MRPAARNIEPVPMVTTKNERPINAIRNPLHNRPADEAENDDDDDGKGCWRLRR